MGKLAANRTEDLTMQRRILLAGAAVADVRHDRAPADVVDAQVDRRRDRTEADARAEDLGVAQRGDGPAAPLDFGELRKEARAKLKSASRHGGLRSLLPE